MRDDGVGLSHVSILGVLSRKEGREGRRDGWTEGGIEDVTLAIVFALFGMVESSNKRLGVGFRRGRRGRERGREGRGAPCRIRRSEFEGGGGRGGGREGGID